MQVINTVEFEEIQKVLIRQGYHSPKLFLENYSVSARGSNHNILVFKKSVRTEEELNKLKVFAYDNDYKLWEVEFDSDMDIDWKQI